MPASPQPTPAEVCNTILAYAKTIVKAFVLIVLWAAMGIAVPYVVYRVFPSQTDVGWQRTADVFAASAFASALVAYSALRAFSEMATWPFLVFLYAGTAYASAISTFAVTYAVIASHSADAFNCPVDLPTAYYFSVTTIATVGFGDLYPKSGTARATVCAEIMTGIFSIS